MQTYRHTDMRTCKHTDTQTYRHADITDISRTYIRTVYTYDNARLRACMGQSNAVMCVPCTPARPHARTPAAPATAHAPSPAPAPARSRALPPELSPNMPTPCAAPSQEPPQGGGAADGGGAAAAGDESTAAEAGGAAEAAEAQWEPEAEVQQRYCRAP